MKLFLLLKHELFSKKDTYTLLYFVQTSCIVTNFYIKTVLDLLDGAEN